MTNTNDDMIAIRFPFGSRVQKEFGDRAIGTVEGINYIERTITVYFFETMLSEEIHIDGLLPLADH